MKLKTALTTLFAISLSNTPVLANCEVDISDYVGWQIIYSGFVTGYIDENGIEQDDFEGCEWGRVLIIDHSEIVICAEYNYSYSYYPNIVILANRDSMAACINDDIYDIISN